MSGLAWPILTPIDNIQNNDRNILYACYGDTIFMLPTYKILTYHIFPLIMISLWKHFCLRTWVWSRGCDIGGFYASQSLIIIWYERLGARVWSMVMSLGALCFTKLYSNLLSFLSIVSCQFSTSALDYLCFSFL